MSDELPDLGFDLDATLDAASSESQDKGKTRKPRSDKGQPRATSRTSTKKLADDLLNPWAKLAKAVALPLPTVSAVLVERGESTVDALVSIASGHPRMLAALTKASKIGPAADLAETAMYIVVAAMLDLGKLSIESPVMVPFAEVAELHMRMQQARAAEMAEAERQMQAAHAPGTFSNGAFAQPPGFPSFVGN